MKKKQGHIPLAAMLFILIIIASITALSKDTAHTSYLSSTIKNAMLNSKGDLIVSASPTSSPSDLDFLSGSHWVHHKKLKSRLKGCEEWTGFGGTHMMESVLGGLGNLEQHEMPAQDGNPVEGVALQLSNSQTKLWSIFSADSRSVNLELPVVGSFENKAGYFYANDTFKGKPILVQFGWDSTNLNEQVRSRAFSTDKEKTSEWKRHMYFPKAPGNARPVLDRSTVQDSAQIAVIELRNYLLKRGNRDRFIDYFDSNFVNSQEQLHGYILGEYRVKENEDRFCWVRGFESMQARSVFLPGFYYGDFWKKHRNFANQMIANNDNVYLLRPLLLKNDSLVAAGFIKASLMHSGKGIVVVDFYISNTKLDQLLTIFAKRYLALWAQCGIGRYSLWISELQQNDFPILPVFQDKNLLVVISFYKDELDYTEKMDMLKAKTDNQLNTDLLDAVTAKQTLILYPIGPGK